MGPRFAAHLLSLHAPHASGLAPNTAHRTPCCALSLGSRHAAPLTLLPRTPTHRTSFSGLSLTYWRTPSPHALNPPFYGFSLSSFHLYTAFRLFGWTAHLSCGTSLARTTHRLPKTTHAHARARARLDCARRVAHIHRTLTRASLYVLFCGWFATTLSSFFLPLFRPHSSFSLSLLNSLHTHTCLWRHLSIRTLYTTLHHLSLSSHYHILSVRYTHGGPFLAVTHSRTLSFLSLIHATYPVLSLWNIFCHIPLAHRSTHAHTPLSRCRTVATYSRLSLATRLPLRSSLSISHTRLSSTLTVYLPPVPLRRISLPPFCACYTTSCTSLKILSCYWTPPLSHLSSHGITCTTHLSSPLPVR